MQSLNLIPELHEIVRALNSRRDRQFFAVFCSLTRSRQFGEKPLAIEDLRTRSQRNRQRNHLRPLDAERMLMSRQG